MNFTPEQIEQIESLAGCNYSPEKIALYFDLNETEFMREWNDKASELRHHYDRGVLIAQAEMDMANLESAKGGSITAIQMHKKDAYSQRIENFKKELNHELNTYDNLQQLISKGSCPALPADEMQLYEQLDLVRGLKFKGYTKETIINSLRISFPMSQSKARQIYIDSINHFYIDNDVKTEAWANMYAEKLDNGARLALEMNDLKMYKEFLAEAAKLRNCYKEKEPEENLELFQKKITIYVTDSLVKNIPRANRNDIATYIDNLADLSYANKQLLHRDAQTGKFEGNILDVDPKNIEYLNNEKD